MIFLDFVFKHRAFTWIVLLLLIVIGFAAYLSMSRSEDPYVEPPVVSVSVIAPGMSPVDLESQILDPLEEEMLPIEGIDHLFGSCESGVVRVLAFLSASADQGQVKDDIESALDAARRDFPAGVSREDVFAPNTLNVKFIQIAITGKDISPRERQHFGQDLIDNLRALNSLEKIEMQGDREEQIRVELRPEMLAERGISFTRVAEIIQASGTTLPLGNVNVGARSFNVLGISEYNSMEQLGNLVIKGGLSPLHLRDVANLSLADGDSTHLVRVNGVPSVLIVAEQKPGLNVFDVVQEVKKTVAQFEATLPSGASVVWIFDQSIEVDRRINTFLVNLLQAIVLVGLIIAFALGWRPSLVVMLAIPVSFVISFAFIYWAGYGLHQMTISAMIISLGLLVDNSIVVTESINMQLLAGKSALNAARIGTSQVAGAIVAATATTLLAFLPIALIQDAAGDFIRSMPVSVMLILAASLLVALTMSPLVSVHVMRPHTFDEQPWAVRKLYIFVKGPYQRALRWCLNHRNRVLFFATAAFVGTMSLFPLIGQSFFPKSDKPLLLVDVKLA